MSLAVLLCTAVLVQAAKARPAKTKLASTPEEAVKFVAEACRAGDPDAVLAQIGEPNRTMISTELKGAQTQEAIEVALDKKFGKEPEKNVKDWRERRGIKESLQRTTSIIVVGKKALGKDKVQLTIWMTNKRDSGKKEQITEMTWTAVKVGKGWKLLVPMGGRPSPEKLVTRKGPDGKQVEVRIQTPDDKPTDSKQLDYVRKAMPKYLAIMEKFKKEVDAGKYKSRKEAQDALEAAQKRFRQENPFPRSEKPKVSKEKDSAAKDKK
jgi:hypothetical protein